MGRIEISEAPLLRAPLCGANKTLVTSQKILNTVNMLQKNTDLRFKTNVFLYQYGDVIFVTPEEAGRS